MEGFERKFEDFDNRQRRDHDQLTEHAQKILQMEKDYQELLAKLDRTREVVNKLVTDRARVIAGSAVASSIAATLIKLFWPSH